MGKWRGMGEKEMRLNRCDLRLAQEGLDFVIQEAEYELEMRHDNEAVCRWARETIGQANLIQEKLEIIIDTLTNLENRDVACDVMLTPGAK